MKTNKPERGQNPTKAESNSESQARAQLESIREMVKQLQTVTAQVQSGDESDKAIEAAREEIEGDALSVEVRSGWMTIEDFAVTEPKRGDYTAIEGPKAAEFKILLCTGGPAVQIIGELDEHCEPEKPRLQHQDWETQWTDYPLTAEAEDALLEYCRVFYFGE